MCDKNLLTYYVFYSYGNGISPKNDSVSVKSTDYLSDVEIYNHFLRKIPAYRVKSKHFNVDWMS